MAIRKHTPAPASALMAILFAALIGSVPVAAFLTLHQTLSSVEVAR